MIDTGNLIICGAGLVLALLLVVSAIAAVQGALAARRGGKMPPHW